MVCVNKQQQQQQQQQNKKCFVDDLNIKKKSNLLKSAVVYVKIIKSLECVYKRDKSCVLNGRIVVFSSLNRIKV